MRAKWTVQSGMVMVAALGSASCGGSSAPDGSGGSGGAVAGGSAAGGTDPSGGETAAGGALASGGTLASGGATGAGGNGDGGGGLVPADLFPLAIGNTWTWVLVSEASPEICDENYLTEEVYATDNIDGRDALVLSAACTPMSLEYDSRLATVEQEITQWVVEQWQVTLSAPLAEGHTWSILSGGSPDDYRWVSTGEVTVPAGTFQNCWTRQLLPEESQSSKTYCPGVGPVRAAYPDLTLELASYHLE